VGAGRAIVLLLLGVLCVVGLVTVIDWISGQ